MNKCILIACLLNFLLISVKANKINDKKNDSPQSLEISSITFFNDTSNLSFQEIKKNETSEFINYNNNILLKDRIYWFKIIIDNKNLPTQNYFIHFDNTFSFIKLFQLKEDNSLTTKIGGCLLPQNKRDAKGFIKDKVSFQLQQDKTVFYLRAINNIEHSYTIDRLQLISETELIEETSGINFIQGIFQGTMVIIMIVNFILFFLSGNRLYLYYALYILFTSIFFLHYYQFSEKYILFNYPNIDLRLFFSIFIAQAVYLLFFLELLKTENVSFWRKYIKYYAWVIFSFCFFILIIGQIDYHLGIMISDYYTVLNAIFIISSYFIFRKKVKLTPKIILNGALAETIGAIITTVVSFSKVSVTNMAYFQIGIFIELLLFTLAINYTYIKEHLKNVEILYKSSLLELDTIQKEKENRKLKEEIDYKNREIASKVMVLSEKETLISGLIKQLRTLKPDKKTNIDIQNIIRNLKLNLSTNSWNEFEIHFNQVHPKFYKILNQKFPNLTAGERKLCAFLKLNMTSKDIASINGKSLNTIDVARSRLRKKMNLQSNENLQTVINNID